MKTKSIVVCLFLASAFLSASELAQKRLLSPMQQMHQILGGKGVRVEQNYTYPEDSLVQRVTFIVNQKGAQVRFFMDYLFNEEGDKIRERRLYAFDNRVLWSASVETMTREERVDAYAKCVDECWDMYKKRPRRQRSRLFAFCVGACDLMYFPEGDPVD
jgi:hypothetical protein